jgi:hypothetical protein
LQIVDVCKADFTVGMTSADLNMGIPGTDSSDPAPASRPTKGNGAARASRRTVPGAGSASRQW